MDEGGIYEEGTPDQIFENPQKENTRRFINRLKVLNLDIDSADADLPTMISQITEYGFRNQVPSVAIYHASLLLEEIAFQMIIPEIEINPHINVTLGYSEISDETELIFKYNGDSFDINDSNNDVSLSVVKGFTKKMNYDTIDESGFTNKLSLVLK